MTHNVSPRAARSPLRWLDSIPMIPLLVGAVLLGLAPVTPEPHLWEKLKMLATGRLTQPLDVFDLFMHGALPLVVILKLTRQRLAARSR